jgi:hypothetical protein
VGQQVGEFVTGLYEYAEITYTVQITVLRPSGARVLDNIPVADATG